MIRVTCFLALAFWIAFHPDALAQAPPRWSFTKGQTYLAERTRTLDQEFTLGQKTHRQKQTSVWRVRLEVRDATAESAWLRATFLNVEHTQDPASDGVDPKLPARMQGASISLRVTPVGDIRALQDHEAFLKQIAGGDPARLTAYRILFSEAAMKEAFADLFGPLPPDRTKPGDAWTRERLAPIPHLGILRASIRHAWDGRKIAYATRTTFVPPPADMSAVFRVTDGKIVEEKSTGSIELNHNAATKFTHEAAGRVRGTVTLEMMKRTFEATFASETRIHATTRLERK